MQSEREPETDERILELEIRAAHQEKLLRELDDVVRAFAARVESLERELDDLRQTASTTAVGPAHDPPPHY